MINLNDDNCIGCGACKILCPDSFEPDPESKLGELKFKVKNHNNNVDEAVKNCPTQAISI